jgi:DNA-binding NarL/FixJ family response regulator
VPVVRVIVADDDPDVRAALIELLADEQGIEVVADASDGSEAIELCLAHRPDVLVVDVNMPRGGGETTARVLSVELPALRIVAISANSDRVTRRRMAEAGAQAFVAKGEMGRLAEVVKKTST